jgi:hypothetical protein
MPEGYFITSFFISDNSTNHWAWVAHGLEPGLPDFPSYNIPKWEQNIPNDHNISQKATKHTKWL